MTSVKHASKRRSRRTPRGVREEMGTGALSRERKMLSGLLHMREVNQKPAPSQKGMLRKMKAAAKPCCAAWIR